MIAEYKQTLRRLRGQILGWGIGVALYGLMMVSLFPSIAGIEGLQDMMNSYPEELMAFFGGAEFLAISTPRGFLSTYFYSYMPVILGIFATGACAGLLVRDEEGGVLDLILSHPISRTKLFWGRVLGFLTATVLILLASWLSWAIPSGSSGMDLTWIDFLLPIIPLFVQLLLWGTLALLLSMFLPSGRMASMVTAALLVGNFLINGLANMNDNLAKLVEFTPLHYFQGADAIDGVNWQWAGILLAVAVAFSLLAWYLFQQRDIRVGGEGGWRFSSLSLLRRRRMRAGTEA